MSRCVITHLSKLKELSKATPKNRRKLLEKANLDLIKSIVECVENVLKGNVTLKKKCKEKLSRYKTILRKIFSSENKLRAKKKLIVQNGGSFLPALLTPVITILAEQLMKRVR